MTGSTISAGSCASSRPKPLARTLGTRSLGDFDLVVGADGAWSKVRPLVSSATAAYTGVLFIELTIDDVDAQHPEAAALIPRGKTSAVGDCGGFIAQRSSNGHVRVYLIFGAAEDRLRAGIADPSSLLAFIDACDDTITPRPIVALPVGHQWPHRRGVTLLGDAAHVMPPFSGEGVNMAMLDGAELALGLAASADWDEAVAQYETRMFARAAAAAARAMGGLAFVSKGALAHVLTHFGVPEADADGAAAAAGGDSTGDMVGASSRSC